MNTDKLTRGRMEEMRGGNGGRGKCDTMRTTQKEERIRGKHLTHFAS